MSQPILRCFSKLHDLFLQQIAIGLNNFFVGLLVNLLVLTTPFWFVCTLSKSFFKRSVLKCIVWFGISKEVMNS